MKNQNETQNKEFKPEFKSIMTNSKHFFIKIVAQLTKNDFHFTTYYIHSTMQDIRVSIYSEKELQKFDKLTNGKLFGTFERIC